MSGTSAATGSGRSRLHAGLAPVALTLVLGLSSAVASPPVPRLSHAAVMATDAADYMPTAVNLPAGYREETTDTVGGDLEPTIAVRRSFVSLDGLRRVVVDIALGTSVEGAHEIVGNRVNQLIRYHGWHITPSNAYGEAAFRGDGALAGGADAAMVLFRIQAVAAEVAVTSLDGGMDAALLDNVTRLVESRIRSDPDGVAQLRGWPPTPAAVPGKDPILVPIGRAAAGAVAPPGAEITGSSTGSPIPGDTVVLLTVTGLERPWGAVGVPRPASGLDYLTVETSIEVHGPTAVTVALTDFWVSTHDGRSWSPVAGRGPSLQPGSVVNGAPASGWLTFTIPSDQPALQLTWRLRTTQSLTAQGNVDQTMMVPLAVGASASASVGTSAPPAGIPVVPPSAAPGGPSGPAGPSGPSAPTPVPSSPGGGGSGGGGSRPRGGTGLQ